MDTISHWARTCLQFESTLEWQEFISGFREIFQFLHCSEILIESYLLLWFLNYRCKCFAIARPELSALFSWNIRARHCEQSVMVQVLQNKCIMESHIDQTATQTQWKQRPGVFIAASFPSGHPRWVTLGCILHHTSKYKQPSIVGKILSSQQYLQWTSMIFFFFCLFYGPSEKSTCYPIGTWSKHIQLGFTEKT